MWGVGVAAIPRVGVVWGEELRIGNREMGGTENTDAERGVINIHLLW